MGTCRRCWSDSCLTETSYGFKPSGCVYEKILSGAPGIKKVEREDYTRRVGRRKHS
jgi:hypothetical protein